MGPPDHRHAFGGLTDAEFRTIPLLAAGGDADWPFRSAAYPSTG
ncbi:hypothetical protein [Nocardia sp. NPDC059691]